MGHFSLFIRQGMQRLNIAGSDKMSDLEAAQKTMVSAYKNEKGKLVIDFINYAKGLESIQLNLENFKKLNQFKAYVTSADAGENMKPQTLKNIGSEIQLPSRSIITIVAN